MSVVAADLAYPVAKLKPQAVFVHPVLMAGGVAHQREIKPALLPHQLLSAVPAERHASSLKRLCHLHPPLHNLSFQRRLRQKAAHPR